MGIVGFVTFRLVERRAPAFGWVVLLMTASGIGYVLSMMWRFRRKQLHPLVKEPTRPEEELDTQSLK